MSSAVGEAFFQELLWVHGMIRQDLETVRELAAQVAGGLAPGEVEAQVASLAANGPLWALKVNCLHYCRFVHGHHRLEDAALFPVLREADPDLAPLIDRLEGDHRRVAEQLDEVEAAVGALNGDEGERARVVEALNELAEDLLAHLKREEDGIGPDDVADGPPPVVAALKILVVAAVGLVLGVAERARAPAQLVSAGWRSSRS